MNDRHRIDPTSAGFSKEQSQNVPQRSLSLWLAIRALQTLTGQRCKKNMGILLERKKVLCQCFIPLAGNIPFQHCVCFGFGTLRGLFSGHMIWLCHFGRSGYLMCPNSHTTQRKLSQNVATLFLWTNHKHITLAWQTVNRGKCIILRWLSLEPPRRTPVWPFFASMSSDHT